MSQSLKEATEKAGWCLSLHGNHDEHQCHLKPGHGTVVDPKEARELQDIQDTHECYCGVWW